MHSDSGAGSTAGWDWFGIALTSARPESSSSGKRQNVLPRSGQRQPHCRRAFCAGASTACQLPPHRPPFPLVLT